MDLASTGLWRQWAGEGLPRHVTGRLANWFPGLNRRVISARAGLLRRKRYVLAAWLQDRLDAHRPASIGAEVKLIQLRSISPRISDADDSGSFIAGS